MKHSFLLFDTSGRHQKANLMEEEREKKNVEMEKEKKNYNFIPKGGKQISSISL